MKKLVDIGDYRLGFDGQGQGKPVVVLDAELNATADSWSLVQPAVARFTRVCRYDRIGMGDGDVIPKPRTCRDLAEDLHGLLTTAREIGPFVLVGHSFGGLIARVYAADCPQEVSGMVHEDAPDPEYPLHALKVFPPPNPDEHPEITDSRTFFTQIADGVDDSAADPWQVCWATSLAQARASSLPPELPLVVVSAGQPGGYPEGFPRDLATQIDALVRDSQRNLLKLSHQSTHLIAEQSGHMVPRDQPALVVEAIRRVVDAVRDQGGR